MHAYHTNGARLTVLIDPEAQEVEMYRPRRQREQQREAVSIALDPDLPASSRTSAPSLLRVLASRGALCLLSCLRRPAPLPGPDGASFAAVRGRLIVSFGSKRSRSRCSSSGTT